MNRKDKYKDMQKWKEATKRQRSRYYEKHSKNAVNRREKYTGEEAEMILKHEISDVELSKLLGRSVRAIQAKRHNMKAVEQ